MKFGFGQLLSRFFEKNSSKIRVVSAKDCYFIRRNLPPRVTVTRQFVDLNYGAESPFAVYQTVYLVQKPELLIWFVRCSEGETRDGELVFPAGMLFAAAGRGQKGETLLVTRSASATEISVVRQGRLLGQYMFGDWTLDEQRIATLVSREHNLNRPELIELTEKNSRELQSAGIKKLSALELQGFWCSSTSREQWWEIFLAKLLPLLAASLVVAMGISVFVTWNLERRVGLLKEKTAMVQKQVRPLLASQKKFMDSERKWSSFVKKEMQASSQIPVYVTVSTVISRDGGRLLRWNGTRSGVEFTALTDSATHLLEQLHKEQLMSNIRIRGAVIKDKKSGMEKAVYAITFPGLTAAKKKGGQA